MSSDERISVSTFVAVAPSAAFEIFTADIERWWRRATRFRGTTTGGALRFEGAAGGRLVEVGAGGDVFEIGRVRVWEPGQRLVLGWRSREFADGELTEVEVRFEPARGGTTVVLEHRGLAALPAAHPVRDRLDGEAFAARIGYFWAERLTDFRARCSGLVT